MIVNKISKQQKQNRLNYFNLRNLLGEMEALIQIQELNFMI